MCCVLDVKPSSYYGWVNRDISEQQIHRNHSELLVRVAHDVIKQRFGYERLHAHLTEQGYAIIKYMVRSLKEEHGIACRRHKRFKITTNSNHNKLVYPNLLDQKFDASRSNLAKQCFSGSAMSPISGRARAGCTWRALKTYILKSLSAMPLISA